MSAIRILVVPLLFSLLKIGASAATTEQTANTSIVSITLTNVPAKQALEFIGAQSGLSIHYLPSTKDAVVSLTMTKALADTAFISVAQQAHLSFSYQPDGVYFFPSR